MQNDFGSCDSMMMERGNGGKDRYEDGVNVDEDEDMREGNDKVVKEDEVMENEQDAKS